MKEDILEQLVDEYLQHKGYFTRHNIKFRPSAGHVDFDSKLDSNHSDIDVVGFNPKVKGAERVLAVSCKSWQSGFRPESKISEIEDNKIVNGREAWKGFRELVMPKWSEAFSQAIYDCCGENKFTYVTAVTVVKGDSSIWENNPKFMEVIGNPIKLISFSDILSELYGDLNTTVAASNVGRMLQLLKASGWLKNA